MFAPELPVWACRVGEGTLARPELREANDSPIVPGLSGHRIRSEKILVREEPGSNRGFSTAFIQLTYQDVILYLVLGAPS